MGHQDQARDRLKPGAAVPRRLPQVVDDFGQAVLLVEGELPEELHGKARLAAANCPEYAIKIVEETRP